MFSGSILPKPVNVTILSAVMKLGVNLEQSSRKELIKMVQRLTAEIEALCQQVTNLKAENEQLKRSNARSAAPFSKNKPKKNPKRPGRKPGQGIFRNRLEPSEEDYSDPPVEVPVEENACPKCGGELGEETEETVTVTEVPPAPKPQVKAYRVKSRACCKCSHKVRGRHPRLRRISSGRRRIVSERARRR